MATRPLAIQKDGTWFCYGWNLTKNICEIFGQNGYIRTAYSYPPYGSVTANGGITQPIQWSSEYADTELALVYYNYRHYNPMDGRWQGRALVEEYRQSLSRYSYTDNNSVWRIDNLGNSWFSDAIDWVVEEVSHVVKVTMDTFNKIKKWKGKMRH